MKVIVPCAGKSSRYPNMRPKWMLTYPDGSLMVKKAIEGLNVPTKDIVITILKEHEEKYDISRGLKENIGNDITVVILNESARSQAGDVWQTLKKLNLKESFLVRDSDNMFEVKDVNEDFNYVCFSDIQEYEQINPGNKSYIKMNDQGIIVDIVEKNVVSRFFNVGGYFFKRPEDFIESYERLIENNKLSEFYVSHIIEDLIFNKKELFFGKIVKSYVDFGTSEEWFRHVHKFKTYFFDLDGILFKNGAQFFKPRWGENGPIEENLKVIKKLSDDPFSQVYFITSRPEEYRELTSSELSKYGITYNSLIMGCRHCKRIIVNDFSNTTGYPTCQAISIMRDSGDLKKYIELNENPLNEESYNLKYLMIEPTNYCNLRCSFCNRENVVKELKNMSIEELKFILEKLKYEKIEVVKLQGLGEPFLNPSFPEMCELLKKYYPNCFLISSTNCQHKSFGDLSRSMKYIDMLYLSVDGLKENYERYRNGASWSKLIEFLDFISTKDYSIKCNINFVATEFNFKDIPGIIELSKRYNLGKLRINIAQDWNQETLCSLGDNSEMINFLKDYREYIIGTPDWEFRDCMWPSERLYLDVFGNVRMCCLNTSGKSFGNIFLEDLLNIRSSKEFKGIDDSIKKNIPPSYCKTCDYKRLSPILKKIMG
jgi:MoaA/NifB/PqqE/SkfB family radical SAM enzyme